jgi:predicted TIM-barrel fold metal-dependent hydrolase
MIIDAHTHLFPEEVRKKRSAYCSRDEAFSLLYGDEKARLAGLEDLLEVMDREGVDRSVICGFPWSDPGLCREGNDYLLSCFQKYPSRVLPFVCFPLRAARQAEKELQRCLSLGAKGIGELAFYRGRITPQGMERLSSLLEPLGGTGIPLLLHVNEPVGHEYRGKSLKTLQPIYQLLLRIPKVDVILAHWGGGFFLYELMPEVARAAQRVYYDTAASPFLYRPQIYSLAVQIIGPGRILWGSDFPLISPDRYFRELAETGLSSPIRDQILGGNARQLLGLR